MKRVTRVISERSRKYLSVFNISGHDVVPVRSYKGIESSPPRKFLEKLSLVLVILPVIHCYQQSIL